MATDDLKVYFADGTVGSLEDLYRRTGQRVTVLRSAQPHKWKLEALREKTDGTQNTDIRVSRANGMPASGVQTAYSYPTLGSPSAALPLTPQTVDRWTERACIDKGRTDASGHAQFTWGSNSYIDPNGSGPYSEFMVDPGIGSDCVVGLGWYRGSFHYGVVDSDWLEVVEGGEDGDGEPGTGGGDYSAQLGRIEAKADAILAKLVEHLK